MPGNNMTENRTEETEALGNGFYVCLSSEHRFSADALLLADFAPVRNRSRIADLGTGCGIIPMLLLKKGSPDSVCGIDIQPEAVRLLARSAELSGVRDRVQALCSDMRTLAGKIPAESFDLVTCNPPYFPVQSGSPSASPARLLARQETGCTLPEVCAAASGLLKNGGRFCLCHRPERLADLVCAMRDSRLELKRMRFVMQNSRSKPWLVLAEGKKGARAGVQILPPFYMTDETGSPSLELMQIYGTAGKE